jgi:hypothetical protein
MSPRLEPRILRWLVDFCKMCPTLLNRVICFCMFHIHRSLLVVKKTFEGSRLEDNEEGGEQYQN